MNKKPRYEVSYSQQNEKQQKYSDAWYCKHTKKAKAWWGETIVVWCFRLPGHQGRHAYVRKHTVKE